MHFYLVLRIAYTFLSFMLSFGVCSSFAKSYSSLLQYIFHYTHTFYVEFRLLHTLLYLFTSTYFLCMHIPSMLSFGVCSSFAKSYSSRQGKSNKRHCFFTSMCMHRSISICHKRCVGTCIYTYNY